MSVDILGTSCDQAEARFNNSLRPRKPEGSLGRTAQDGHLDSHTAPELCTDMCVFITNNVVVFTMRQWCLQLCVFTVR